MVFIVPREFAKQAKKMADILKDESWREEIHKEMQEIKEDEK